MTKYRIIFLELVKEFLDELNSKIRKKVLYNAWKSTEVNDPELFKKLNDNIWEFRTNFLTKQIRLLAFWDKTEKTDTLVIATHGYIKKTRKTPKTEIEKAEKIREKYFNDQKEK